MKIYNHLLPESLLGIQSEIKILLPIPVLQGLHSAVPLRHRPLITPSVVLSRSRPIQITRRLTQLRLNGPGGRNSQAQLAGTNRHTQTRRRRRPQPTIHILEPPPEQRVENHVAVRLKIRSIPPEPIAPLRRIQILPRRCDHFRRKVSLGLRLPEKIPRSLNPVPSKVFLGIPDPDVKVSADPRSGMKPPGGSPLFVVQIPSQCLRLQTLRPTQLAVKSVQKCLPTIRKRLPRVFSVQGQKNNSVLRHHLGDVLKVGP